MDSHRPARAAERASLDASGAVPSPCRLVLLNRPKLSAAASQRSPASRARAINRRPSAPSNSSNQSIASRPSTTPDQFFHPASARARRRISASPRPSSSALDRNSRLACQYRPASNSARAESRIASEGPVTRGPGAAPQSRTSRSIVPTNFTAPRTPPNCTDETRCL